MPADSYQTEWIRAGTGSLNLSAIDHLPEGDWTRITNAVRRQDGAWTSRLGQTSVTNALGTTHHTIARLADPQAGTMTRIWGIDQTLYYGGSGALNSAETGFSGDPLTLVEARPPLSGDTWMYVADRTKMRKIRPDGLDLPIGLTPVAAAPTVALAAELSVTIEDFETGFTGYAGSGGAPTLTYPAAKAGNGLNILTAVGAATTGYYNQADKALTLDLTTFGSGVVATDEEFIHLWLKVDRPDFISDIKVYFVVSTFTGGVVPGQSTTQNTDAYFKSFVASDFTTIVELTQGPESAAEDASRLDQIDDTLTHYDDTRQLVEAFRARYEARRLAALQQTVGRGQWTEYGVVGLPLRKSDFARIGSGSVNWSTVTGIVIVVQTATNQAVNVTLDQAFLRGGRGPDTADVGQTQYDYRIIHYDPRTGAKGNPSPIQAESLWVDSLRRAITITPAAAFGDAAIRQWAFRRGGSPDTSDDWRFVGENSSDGGAITDLLGDDEILLEETLEIDNDQPVSTVTEAGVTVLNQPIPVLFGPIEGYLFGLGDPYRPGHVYWSKKGTFDSWPAANRYEACSPSEELMAGGVFGTQAFCWSRQRLFAVLPDQTGPNGTIVVPTACTRGIMSRWSWCVGPDGLYAFDHRGIYRTNGGPPEELTDPWLRPIFQGVNANGYTAIDFAVSVAMRMTFHGHELWVLYQDTAGARRVLIFNPLTKAWRAASFARAPACFFSERRPDTSETLFIGGATTGRSYTHSGTEDDGVGITVTLRSAAQTAGLPRHLKALGDLVVDADRQGVTLTVTPYLDYESSALAAGFVDSGSGRQQTVLNPFSTTPTEARNLSLEISWTSQTARPICYGLGWSYRRLPESTTTRPTDWEDLGTPAAKLLKGVALLVDTGGTDKTVLVESLLDNGSIATVATLTVNTNGRRLATFSWVGTRVTLFRLRPTDLDLWQQYGISWLADPDALGRTRWEGQPTDHGIPGWQTVYWAEVALRSVAEVTLSVTITEENGTTYLQTYTIASTGGAKQVRQVPFLAVKGVLFAYAFSCGSPFWIYPQESRVCVAPWAGDSQFIPALGLPDVQEGERFLAGAAR